jgi:selenium metabolism protein YedF
MVVDCRGLACPIPVLKTKEALEKIEEGTITVIVDNKASKENVKRFAQKVGCSVEVEEKDGLYYLTITKGKGQTEVQGEQKGEKREKEVTVLVASSYVGEEEELGKILMKGFLKTFLNASPKPTKLILINAGVKLACQGSDPEILEALKELQESGTEIICCGTCLEYYGLLDKLQVGAPSNAYDVVQALTNSDLVVRL